jgi:hypothetical protein
MTEGDPGFGSVATLRKSTAATAGSLADSMTVPREEWER